MLQVGRQPERHGLGDLQDSRRGERWHGGRVDTGPHPWRGERSVAPYGALTTALLRARARCLQGISSLEKTLPDDREKVVRCGERWPMKNVYVMNVEAANCVVNCLRKTHRSVYDGMHAVINWCRRYHGRQRP